MNIEIDNERKSKSLSMAKINEGLSDSEAAKLEVRCMVYYEDKWNPSMCETLNIRVAGDSARSVHKKTQHFNVIFPTKTTEIIKIHFVSFGRLFHDQWPDYPM